MARRNYDFNYKTMTLTMTKSFEDAIKDPFSAEYKILRQLRKDFPMLKISKKKTSHNGKGLTYEKMEEYIKVYSNSEEILPLFEMAKELSVIQSNKYGFVKKWFLNQFPDYKEMPELDENGKLYAIPFVPKAKGMKEEKKNGTEM